MTMNKLTIDNRELETAAVSISIAAGCEPCTRFHVREARKLGATDVDLALAVTFSGENRGAAQIATTEILNGSANSQRQIAFAGIGSAACANNVTALRQAIADAHSSEISDNDIMAVIGLATRIKEKAASHLDRVINRLDADADVAVKAANLCT